MILAGAIGSGHSWCCKRQRECVGEYETRGGRFKHDEEEILSTIVDGYPQFTIFRKQRRKGPAPNNELNLRELLAKIQKQRERDL